MYVAMQHNLFCYGFDSTLSRFNYVRMENREYENTTKSAPVAPEVATKLKNQI